MKNKSKNKSSQKDQFGPDPLVRSLIGQTTSKSSVNLEPNKEKNAHAVALGRLGGLKGGKARAKLLSPERRREIARNAAESRWSKK